MSISGLSVIKLESDSEFSTAEKKFLKMVDLELGQRNPNIVLEIVEKELGICHISLRNEFLNITKKAYNKEECIEKIRKLMSTLKFMECDHNKTGVFEK